MAITHAAATRNNLANQILSDIGSSGKVVFMTSGDVEVATLALSATAGVVSGPTLTYNSISSDTDATGGTIALFKVTTSSDVEIYRGTVTATGGGGDIELSSLVISAGDTVSITSMTYTASV